MASLNKIYLFAKHRNFMQKWSVRLKYFGLETSVLEGSPHPKGPLQVSLLFSAFAPNFLFENSTSVSQIRNFGSTRISNFFFYDIKKFSGKSFGLRFIWNQSDFFRFIPKSVSELRGRSLITWYVFTQFLHPPPDPWVAVRFQRTPPPVCYHGIFLSDSR